jgi:tripartite-type tricarboxylate transporter receptor subunit TctC
MAAQPNPPPSNARRRLLLAAALSPWVHAAAHAADDYPGRAVTLVVSLPPGSGADTTARLFARRLQEISGKPFVVENKVGGNSFIAAQAVARAAPDGHTLFFSSSTPVAMNVVLLKKMPYDPLTDFVPVARAARGTNLVVVAAGSPLRTLADLVNAAKLKPNSLSYAAGSAGYHLATAMLAQQLGVECLHVPYKGSAPALVDTAGGVTDFALADVSAALPLVSSGRLRALAVTADARHPSLPAVPTADEAGAKGYTYDNWMGLYAPARTPNSIVERLATWLGQVAAEPSTVASLNKLGLESYFAGPRDLAAFQRWEIARWREAAAKAKIEAE